MAGFTAFREAYFRAGGIETAEFGDWDARRMRYQLFWAFYENTIYRNIDAWAIHYRQSQGLYKYIRGIYNPAYRLGEFWRTHLWGGALDLEAGDGEEHPSAIPIITDNERLRDPIGQVWRWSNWAINKGICSLWGSVLGDVAIQVVDDPKKRKVYLQIVHPAIIADVDLDNWGNVKGYKIEEERIDPRNDQNMVTYTEIATRDGQNVLYQTLLNDAPYPWSGGKSEWTLPYGFVPMVMIQHNTVGGQWGWSEMHASRSKFQEVDDIASKLGDQIRKMVDAPWLLSGVSKPRATPGVSGRTPTADMPQPGREEFPAIYADAGAHAQHLVAPLDLASTGNHIMSLIAELERDYPELQMDIWSNGGEVSGRALRIARQRVVTKVNERRAIYDDALARAQMMAVAIGGFRGLEGFGGFSLESYEKGDLDHSIGERPVFSADPLDDLEIESAFWTTAEHAQKSIGLELFLVRNGWTEEEIADLKKSPEYKARMAALEAQTLMAQGMGMGGSEGGGDPFGGKNPEAAVSNAVQ